MRYVAPSRGESPLDRRSRGGGEWVPKGRSPPLPPLYPEHWVRAVHCDMMGWVGHWSGFISYCVISYCVLLPCQELRISPKLLLKSLEPSVETVWGHNDRVLAW